MSSFILIHLCALYTKYIRKEFTFYEGADLVICPIIPFLALAFTDDAFEANITTPTEIYDLVIPARKTRMHLKWKTEWAERPIFRDVEATPTGVRISENKHLQYSKHRYHFIHLGCACGFEKVLQFYDLRRASGKKITGKKATSLVERALIWC